VTENSNANGQGTMWKTHKVDAPCRVKWYEQKNTTHSTTLEVLIALLLKIQKFLYVTP